MDKPCSPLPLAIAFVILSASSSFSQTTDFPASPSQLKTTARENFAQGDADAGRERLTALLELYRDLSIADQSTRGRYQWSARLAEVAQEYLRAGELQAAMSVLGEAAELDVPLQNGLDNGLAGAAGGLHRRLLQLDADQRYDLLHQWSMPTESRQTVRTLRSIVPTSAPPTVFARALGERPRDTSFPISAVGEVEGLFSTAWSLLQAAEKTGRLTRLIRELTELSRQQIPGADEVLTLAMILNADERDEQLVETLRQHLANFQQQPDQDSPERDPLGDIVLAAACLKHDWLQNIGEDIFEKLIEDTWGTESFLIRPFLRRAHATALRRRFADVEEDLITNPDLGDWVPTSGYSSTLNAQGAVRPVWLVQEGHIMHLAGPRLDTLLLRYPLTGDFEFTCEAQDSGRGGTEGGVTYGGMRYEAWGAGQSFKVWDADCRNVVQQPWPLVRMEEGRPTFNRLALRSTAERVTFRSNGHAVWNETSKDRSSPWIGLRSFNDRRPIFRNLKITGSPVIPREVHMSDGDRLAGWQAGYFSQSRSPAADADWYAKDGVIRGAHRPNDSDAVLPGRLSYFRPLLDGESISYQFQYEPGKYEVHPALGRLAFLIVPDGVRLRWMADGDMDWTGLTEDDEVVEPLNRRGPRKLPLVADEWNEVTLALNRDVATLSLNGTTIYVRRLEADNERTFGLYHDRSRSGVRVRNVVMRGDWPERLTADQLANPAPNTEATLARTGRRFLNALFKEEYLAENVLAVHRRAMSLPPPERFEYLANWVLPGEDHPTFRLVGEFTAEQPAPSGGVQSDANLIAPAFDLVDAARELGQLDELRELVSRAELEDESEEKASRALLMLIDIARTDTESAIREFEELFSLADPTGVDELPARWPETLALWHAIRHPDTRSIAAELLYAVHRRAFNRFKFRRTTTVWNNHICAMAGLLEHLSEDGAAIDEFTSPPALEHWIPTTDASAQSRGEGFPPSHWRWRGNRVDHLSGHNQWDYLFYRMPLRGDYEVECDVTHATALRMQLQVAGKSVFPRWDLAHVDSGTFRSEGDSGPVDPKLNLFGDWVRYRVVVRDGVRSTWFNGRKIHEEPVSDDADPWFAMRSWSRYHSTVRNLRVTGQPKIPDQVTLTKAPGLPGWKPYFDDTVGGTDMDWWQLGDLEGGGIVGRRKPEFAGSGMESLLRYHRPMAEDGTIEYDFYYVPGTVHTHPALDRLALMLEPSGVRVHWITDGKYDRTGIDPSNIFDEPENRRGPRELPLQPDQWNHLRLTLRGNTIDLELNKQLVYRRDLESTNQRTFGLFHFAGETEIRGRNVVWRGDWPRALPAQQELDDDGTIALDERSAELKAVFQHDFARDGLPEKLFQIHGEGVENLVTPRPDGVHVVRPGIDKWSQTAFGPRLRAAGDFDITASFEQFKSEIPIHGYIQMRAVLREKSHFLCRIARAYQATGRHAITGEAIEYLADGQRALGNHECSEATSGRLRISRRGDMVHFLFAEADSPRFRIIASERATTDSLPVKGITLNAIKMGPGTTSVVWKDLSVRAEKLMFIPRELDKPVLFVMTADGKDVRQLTKPIGDLGSHGSPAWSPDGKQVAFDTYAGSTATSHIYTVNADGTELKDLGIGSMPTYSPDGKQIAFSWSGRGITLMDADGKNREVLDPGGWGAQRSPDGKAIAYGSRNITILDLATKQQRTILEGAHERRYRYIYWNMAWSLDSKRICFMGRKRDGKYEIGTVNAAGSNNGFKLLHTLDKQIHADFSWHPDGKQILCAMHNPRLGGSRIYTLDSDNAGPPKLFATQPLDQNSTSAVWSRDGKHIVFSSQRPPAWEEEVQQVR